ncbi:hypothetical protein [Dellaglioa algida]|uniref:Bacterial archaeo-eukaryotic release factor family 6 domain-containing protein n=1 Tax=Dellaglioa algida TaxID=105612 RepID=A0A2C8EM31_9LACO|nr:hypothetical protein [Dellaglioa algida]MDK1717445.1 hypothetical protein [Dellaglioa algida]MDK1719179.1 hypothetical protein [Dellaglioa algida]MDK1720680.1 hypothetical protein [Dellaglioa algida]MDK1722387.1 hypothetical protein [Dellaglioa algida]MDK1724011.1 hypothetical protein [Dellaglioa algida]
MSMHNNLKELLTIKEGPVVSIFIKTYPGINFAAKNQLKLKTSLKTAKEEHSDIDKKAWGAIEGQLTNFMNDIADRIGQFPSIALYLTPNNYFKFNLNHAIELDQVIVGPEAYTLPLLAQQATKLSGTILSLNRDSFELHQFKEGILLKQELPKDAPIDMVSALGPERTDTTTTHGPTGALHGLNTKDEEKAIDNKNYYLAIEQFLMAHTDLIYKRLFIIGLPKNQSLFRDLTKLKTVNSEITIKKSPSALTTAEIEKELLDQNQVLIDQTVEKLLDRARSLDEVNPSETNPAELFALLTQHRVKTLLINEESMFPGLIVDGQIVDTEPGKTTNNLLNDLANFTLRNGGDVYVISATHFNSGQFVYGV